MKTTYKIFTAITTILLIGIVVFVIFKPSVVSASVSPNCASGVMTFDEFRNFRSNGLVSNKALINIGANSASVTIVNDTNCSMPATLQSWKMFSTDKNVPTQVPFDSSSTTISAHSNATLSVDLPNCMAQIDAYYGSPRSTVVGDREFLMGWGFSQVGNVCTNVPPPPPVLTTSCSANPSSITTGQSSTFTAAPSGGTGSYTYSWSGADGLSGSGSSVSKIYSTSGTKTATVTVTSGSQTASANCSVNVAQSIADLTASCSASPSSVNIGQSATFMSNVSGGTGSYTYLWTGACTGSNINCTNTFNNQGTYSAGLTVTSGSQTVSATCPIVVSQNCTPNYEQRCIGSNRYWYDSCGNQGSYIGTCGVNNAYLTVTKTVRNLTIGTGSGFANSVYASPSDMVMFMITLQNPGNTTGNQDAQNVVVRDVLPANLIYNNQMIVARTNNVYGSYYGDIMSGLNLGTIPAGQTATITFQAQVAQAANFAFGTTTLNNVVNITSSNVSYIPNATASVVVTRAGVLGASTIPTGLTNNFWADSFLLPLLITLISIWMWKSGMFFGAERWLNHKKIASQTYKSEKELSARIAQIRKLEKA